MVVARKTTNDPRFKFFITREEAEDWLAETKLAGDGPASGRALKYDGDTRTAATAAKLARSHRSNGCP